MSTITPSTQMTTARRVLFDPSTGTVVGAEDSLLVELDELSRRLGTEDADVLLSEENPRAQQIAAEIGVSLTERPSIDPEYLDGIEDIRDADRVEVARTSRDAQGRIILKTTSSSQPSRPWQCCARSGRTHEHPGPSRIP